MEFYQEDSNFLRKTVGWIVDIVVVISLAWFVVYAFGTQVQMAGQSMTPGLRGGDVVLMDRLAYDLGNPHRFDVVVFQREDKKSNIKRVIGLPGETVQIVGGDVFINGTRLETKEGLNPVALAGLADNPVILEDDEYFLLGDNRDSSEDSRFANIGNVKRSQIKGKIWFRLLPLMEMKLVE